MTAHVTANLGWIDLAGRLPVASGSHLPTALQPARSIGVRQYAPIATAPDQFSEYESYNFPGWDGHDALPITPETIRSARSFNRLLPMDAPHPDIAPGSDGTIGFEWRSGFGNTRSWIMVDIGPNDLVRARPVNAAGRSERLQPTRVGTGARALIDQLFSS